MSRTRQYRITTETVDVTGVPRHYVAVVTDDEGRQVWDSTPQFTKTEARAEAEDYIANLRSRGY